MASLHLTRYAGQQVVINDNVIITIVSNNEGKTHLLIEAPREVPIDRAEIHAQKLAAERGNPFLKVDDISVCAKEVNGNVKGQAPNESWDFKGRLANTRRHH